MWDGAVCGPQVQAGMPGEGAGGEVGRGWVVSMACVRDSGTSGAWVLWLFGV